MKNSLLLDMRQGHAGHAGEAMARRGRQGHAGVWGTCFEVRGNPRLECHLNLYIGGLRLAWSPTGESRCDLNRPSLWRHRVMSCLSTAIAPCSYLIVDGFPRPVVRCIFSTSGLPSGCDGFTLVWTLHMGWESRGGTVNTKSFFRKTPWNSNIYQKPVWSTWIQSTHPLWRVHREWNHRTPKVN